tara:strand:- start:1441 stop:1848 length:408 start_codon:yes stop_codon:yes gene_type:complete
MKLKYEIEKLNSIIEEKLDIDSINTKEKTSDQVLGRMIACNILMDNGVTPAGLAQYYCKDRSNFYHYRKKHNTYIENPKIFPEYIKLYEAVEEDFVKRATDFRLLDKLQRMEVLDSINKNIDELLVRRTDVLKTL